MKTLLNLIKPISNTQFPSSWIFSCTLRTRETKKRKEVTTSLNKDLLIDDIIEHDRAVMMNQVPPAIVELKQIGDEEWTSVHIHVCFHGDPSHAAYYPSAHVVDLKVIPLFPVETKFPALHHFPVPAIIGGAISLDDLSRFIQIKSSKMYLFQC